MKPAPALSIRPARKADTRAITALLQISGLGHDDLAAHLRHFLVAQDGEDVVGVIGAEVHAGAALLRSLAVAPAHRGTGLGRALVRAADEAGARWGVTQWWLLTTSAEAFFARDGFRVAERGEAPPEIQRTGQFTGGVCRSAVCLTRARRATPEFDAALAEFTTKLRAFIRRRVRDDATADDLTQETLLKVYRSRASLRDGQRLEAWVYRIARTTLIDHFRRQRPSDELPESLASEPADEVAAIRGVIVHATRIYLEELPDAYREPVRLAEFEGLPLAKIALRLGLSLTAVKSRVQRGRAMLKKKLQDCCRFEFDRGGKLIGYERRRAPGPVTEAAARRGCVC
ncbi:RNA polymerase sigma factor SigZ [Opitutus sp. ER46]|uniref:RNA polymerase sigma factor SigZ n=1 Tax=Opitutus sp. ER46 TaxID=2161864 RepID=UPI0013049B89|nr:RNA polymerase sigma factor SigZ [Opitutus sp. ER46]